MTPEQWAELLELLRDLEWVENHDLEPACPLCGRLKRQGHKPDCRLAEALGRQAAQDGPG